MAGMFAAAAQPDVVRAAQKDQQYLSIVTEALSSAVSGVAGQFRRLQWERWGHNSICYVCCALGVLCRHRPGQCMCVLALGAERHMLLPGCCITPSQQARGCRRLERSIATCCKSQVWLFGLV